MAPGNTCAYSVTFAPPAGISPGATFTGNLTVNGTNGASLVVALSGTVPPPAPTVSLSTTSLSFPSQAVGTTSSSRSVVLTNTGNFSASITSFNGDYVGYVILPRYYHLNGYEPRDVPTEHVPTRRAAAREKFAWLEAISRSLLAA